MRLQNKKGLNELSTMFLELCFNLILSFLKRKTQNEKKKVVLVWKASYYMLRTSFLGL